MRTPHLAAALALTGWLAPATATAQKGVKLSQLVEVARARAATIRPQLEAKLAPHLEVLASSYESNWATINAEVEKVVQLGPPIVPLLLEKLEPRRESPRERNLAANCSLALKKLQPSTFVDHLIEIAQGENYTGVGLAIPLLGETGSERAGTALTQLLGHLDAAHRRRAVAALTQLGHRGAVLVVAKGLPYEGAEDRAAVDYLAKIGAREVVPEVRRALKEVKRTPDIMRYIRLLASCAKGDAETAHALLPLFDHEKLDRLYWAEIARSLAVIAPEGDEPTIQRLRTIVKNPNPGTLEIRAGLTLRALGDSVGPDILRKTLVRLTQSSKTKKDYIAWSNLGEFLLETGDYKRAVAAYKSAATLASNKNVQSLMYIHMARAQARRSPPRPRDIRNALRDSQASYARLMEEAAADPALAEAMKLPEVKKFMDSFPK